MRVEFDDTGVLFVHTEMGEDMPEVWTKPDGERVIALTIDNLKEIVKKARAFPPVDKQLSLMTQQEALTWFATGDKP